MNFRTHHHTATSSQFANPNPLAASIVDPKKTAIDGSTGTIAPNIAGHGADNGNWIAFHNA